MNVYSINTDKSSVIVVAHLTTNTFLDSITIQLFLTNDGITFLIVHCFVGHMNNIRVMPLIYLGCTY